MADKNTYTIFKEGSKTYFNSALFFPKDVREKIFILYSFVRTADNFVDTIPQQKEEFIDFVNEYHSSLTTGKSNNDVINNFYKLSIDEEFKNEWTEAFLKSMQMDLEKKEYSDIVELEKYIYGSAEVIGLMLAKILKLDGKSYYNASMLGKAMQYINFIRDINIDLSLGRIYMPKNELSNYGLKTLSYDLVINNQVDFKRFIREQIERYFAWQNEAEKGFKYIPKKYLVPIKTASDMYKWTAGMIKNDPLIVYDKVVKPSKIRIYSNILWNMINNI